MLLQRGKKAVILGAMSAELIGIGMIIVGCAVESIIAIILGAAAIVCGSILLINGHLRRVW